MRKVIVWGCGKHAIEEFNRFPFYMGNIEAFADRDPEKIGKTFFGRPIIHPNEILQMDVQDIIITIENPQVVEEIKAEMTRFNCITIEEYEKQLIEEFSVNPTTHYIGNKDITEKQLRKLNDRKLRGTYGIQFISAPDSMTWFDTYPEYEIAREKYIARNSVNNMKDYTRLWAFILNINHIMNDSHDVVQGDFAELGVYKGNNCAVFLEYCKLYNRKLYMFDTFEGFSDKDMVGIDDAQEQRFDDTSLDKVKEFVGEDEHTVYIPGYFPESVTDECRMSTFAFVSIDCDLYKPVRAGLDFFYPRLSDGGEIFIHDYSGRFYKGCKTAVDEFCITHQIRGVLLPDKAGSFVIIK